MLPIYCGMQRLNPAKSGRMLLVRPWILHESDPTVASVPTGRCIPNVPTYRQAIC